MKNKENLIRLGVILANKYGIENDVKIMRVPDGITRFRLLVILELNANEKSAEFIPTIVDFDEVLLDSFAFKDGFEFIRAGYSSKTKTMLIQEIE